MTNEQLLTLLIQKGIIVSSDLAAGGKLTPEQADRMIDYVVDLSGLKDKVRVHKFTNEQSYIDKISVFKRAAVAATEATDPTIRRGVSTSRITMTPKEIMTPWAISDIFKEINIEGENVSDHIARMMADQLANDDETLAITGDVLGPAIIEGDYKEGGSTTQVVKDEFIGLFNGWLREADSGNIVDAAGASISADLFNTMLNAMPDKFKRDPSKLVFICAPSLEQNYRQKVGTRMTVEGDKAIQSMVPLTPFGIPLVRFPLWPFYTPVVEHVTLAGTTAVALRYKPIDVGSETVVDDTLGSTPVTPYVEGAGNDYLMDYDNGTIARLAGGTIGDPTDVKVTYTALPQMLLTHYMNLIWAIGRDIRIEKDRNIFARTDEFAITHKMDAVIEEVTAVVKAKNISRSVS